MLYSWHPKALAALAQCCSWLCSLLWSYLPAAPSPRMQEAERLRQRVLDLERQLGAATARAAGPAQARSMHVCV